MFRHVVLTQFEAASSLIYFEPGVFENFTFESAINKMIKTEQKLHKVSSAKGTIFESVNVLVELLRELLTHFVRQDI
jgi:hypothetical protein